MLLPWWLYVVQTAECMPGKLSDGSIHPVSVLLSITSALEKRTVISVFSLQVGKPGMLQWSDLARVTHQAAGKAGNKSSLPSYLFSALSAFSPLSLPKYLCSRPFPISLTLSQNKQRVVLKHSTVHLIGTRIRTKLQIKQLHCAYWHSPCGFSWINLFVSPLKHCCEWL